MVRVVPKKDDAALIIVGEMSVRQSLGKESFLDDYLLGPKLLVFT